ncbi:MAG: COGs COG0840 [uncultured Nocardioidaceae bacterium]|uniref:COGs COG0840 n=1 Tax=uncultured Nocardioidaceae bacterium TaxID=253824 RepID=A0A6J4M971_9ACTN|nr:MAG: COGs COG0840 [uncultured Nocardioidaceae bacterium]
MCRNIRTLHNFEPPASRDEVHAASLQYVRKISGTSKPSQANQAAFDRAVDEVAAVTARLLDSLSTSTPPKDREVEAAKARARAAERYGAAAAR